MTDALCVICGSPGSRLCSSDCAEAAVRERERNVVRWRRLAQERDATERRAELAMRNGELTSALIGAPASIG